MVHEPADEVVLTFPATVDNVRLARLVTSGIATRAGFDYDTVEDLRIAVDELCSVLVANAADSRPLRLRFNGGTRRMEVRGDIAYASGGDPVVDELTRQILAAVVDQYDVSSGDGVLRFTIQHTSVGDDS
jgi:serine/threonine-protein kinase RsbW